MNQALLWACVIMSSACRHDMQDQFRAEPYEASDFFSDGRVMRPWVEHTVPVGPEPQLGPPSDLWTMRRLQRGRERYEIYCSPCHDRLGRGEGTVVRRGYRQPPSFHVERLRNAPLTHLVDVITHGLGTMPDHAAQIAPADRWAIAAYLRVLQFSQHAPLAALTPDLRRNLPNP